MRAIDFTPEQDARREVARTAIAHMLKVHLDTPEHRMVLLASLMDELIGETADLRTVSACLTTLCQTYGHVMQGLARSEGAA